MKTSYIDFKQQLEYLCPNLILYYGPTDEKWNAIAEKYNKRVLSNAEKLKHQDPFQIQTTIYDLVIAVNEGNIAAKYFLKHIDKISKNLFDHIPDILHDSLKKSFLGIFENFGDTESKYLDKIGELAILEKIILNSELKLDKIEYKLQNNKSIDFSFTTEHNPDELLLVEVFNIHIKSEKLENIDNFKKFIENRIGNKLQNKLINVKPEKNKSYSLIPLIWGDLADLIKFKSVFPELKKIKLIREIMTFLQLTDGNNFYSFELNSINIILEKYSKHHGNNI